MLGPTENAFRHPFVDPHQDACSVHHREMSHQSGTVAMRRIAETRVVDPLGLGEDGSKFGFDGGFG